MPRAEPRRSAVRVAFQVRSVRVWCITQTGPQKERHAREAHKDTARLGHWLSFCTGSPAQNPCGARTAPSATGSLRFCMGPAPSL